MSLLFDDASLQYALATNPAIALPFATGCWIYLDDIDVDQTFAAFQDASSEDNRYTLGLYAPKQEVTDITCVADFQSSNSLDGEYFTLSSPTTDYYVWLSIDSASVDPAPASKTGIEVNIAADASALAVAIAVQIVLDAHIDFGASVISDVVTVTNAVVGITTDAADFDTGFTFDIIVQGSDDAVIRGEIVDNVSVSEIADSPAPVSLNTWHHALVIFNTATDIRVYLDGANEGLSPGGTAVAPIGLDTLSIGRRSKLTPDQYMSGRIAELTTWNLSTVLSASEIGDLGSDMFSSLLVRTDELLYFAPIYNNDDPIIDIMLHQNATLFNGPATADHPPVQTFEPETFGRFRVGPVEFILGGEGEQPFSDLLFTALANWELIKSASNDIGFQQQVQHNVIVLNVASNISFGQVVGKTQTFNILVETNVNFSQNMGPTTERTLSSDIAFTAEASRGDHLISEILFGQSVVAEASKGTSNDILFTQDVAIQLDINPVAQSSILFGQSVEALVCSPAAQCEVIPLAGDISLTCSGGSITLRNPDFGNQESLDVDRALNVSRGGSIQVYRDPVWPEQTTHTISISVMTRVKAQELLDFLKDCLGLLVTYVDHESVAWEGIITNPDTAVLDGGSMDCKYSASITFVGTLV